MVLKSKVRISSILFRFVVIMLTVAVAFLTIGLIGYLLKKGLPYVNRAFLFTEPDILMDSYGIKPMLINTIYTVVLIDLLYPVRNRFSNLFGGICQTRKNCFGNTICN